MDVYIDPHISFLYTPVIIIHCGCFILYTLGKLAIVVKLYKKITEQNYDSCVAKLPIQDAV